MLPISKIKQILKVARRLQKKSHMEAYYCFEWEMFAASDDKSWIRWSVYYLLFPRKQSLIPVERKYQFERKCLRFIILNMNTMKDDLTFAFKEMNCKKTSNEFYIVSCRFAYVVCFGKHFIFTTSFFTLRDNISR